MAASPGGGSGFSCLQSGAKVKVTGLLHKPTKSDPEPLWTQDLVVKTADSKAIVREHLPPADYASGRCSLTWDVVELCLQSPNGKG